MKPCLDIILALVKNLTNYSKTQKKFPENLDMRTLIVQNCEFSEN